ncbi:large neutral amino acids transporter small subunit 2-like [Mya arenaria]|uniref:large neutral amino acids transporter small subunit 2-like n=1 Tax=Mya arenaria TaxID=6604 RepID=UPI0022E1A3F0|nr:large neutral amino acids transporter small subunit 2-like [Mya arenaria]XP_052816836.1 large neutral amino acids transporter small subunit 2-like [Mya arenaria]XP_052816837.1 large neutral amino acids transporter small subunit 2-like [Mya arenaria]
MDETMPGPDTSNLLTAGQAEPAEVSKAIKREQSPSIEIVHPKLTVFQTCAIVVSSVGGSGLFVAMSTIMRTSGSVGAMLIVVLISGLLNYSLANCFAEVAVQLPKAGGPYFFIKQVFGDFPAFLFLWGFFFLIVTPIWGFLAYTSAIYIVQLFFPGCQPPDEAVKLLAIVILALTILANCMYLPFVTKLQMILTSAKIVAMLIIIIAGIVALIDGEGMSYTMIFEGSSTQPGDYAVSILAGTFLFGGWQLITFLLEEMDSPEKNLPKTLSISFTIAITLSELVVAAYFVVLSPQEVLSGDAVAVMFMNKIYRPMSPVISIFVTATSIGSLNAVVLAQSRMVSTAARLGHMPEIMSFQSSSYNMPWPAIFGVSLISLVMLLLLEASTIIKMTSFMATVMGLAVLLCLLALRVRKPDAHRPLQVWLGTAIFQLVLNVATLLMSIYQEPRDIGLLALFMLAGTPVYIVCVRWSKPKEVEKLIGSLNLSLQKLLLLKKM